MSDVGTASQHDEGLVTFLVYPPDDLVLAGRRTTTIDPVGRCQANAVM
jgi:hypothetical protein